MYFKHSRFLKFNHSLCTAANRQAPEMQQIHGGLHITQLCMPQPLHEASSRHTYCSFHRYCLAIADDRSSRPLIQLIQPLIQTSSMLYLLIRRVKTPPRVSIPRDSGVTSSSSRSVTSPFMTPPWMAAPEATTSSGFTPREGSFLNRSFTMLLTCVYTERVRTMDRKQISSRQHCLLYSGTCHKLKAFLVCRESYLQKIPAFKAVYAVIPASSTALSICLTHWPTLTHTP